MTSQIELNELKTSIVRRYDQKARLHGSVWQEPTELRTEVAERSIEELAAPVSKDVLLDIGTGRRGRYLSRLARVGQQSVGIDISFETAAAARRHLLTENAANANIVVASADALPFVAGTFSLVVCAEVFEYYPLNHVATILGEIRRVLRGAGRTVVDFPDFTDSRVLTLKRSEEADGVAFFVHTLTDITAVIELAGFAIHAQLKCDVELQFALVHRR
jgi:ubiquinone/menaquinone biosynthesis C-methylase UbiE